MTATERTFKAYKLSCRDDDHGASVVFATTVKDAKKLFHSDRCDCHFLERTAHRAPDFDQYADSGTVTIAQYLEQGWYWECGECGNRLYDDESPIIVENTWVYCNRQCLQAAHSYWKDSLAKGKACPSMVSLLEMLERWLKENP